MGRAGGLAAVIVWRRFVLGIDPRMPHSPQPIVPGDVAAVDQDCLIVGVVANVLEEDAAAEGRDLEGGDVYVRVEGSPSVCTYAVGYDGCEQAVEVEEEEDGEDAADQQLNQEHPAIWLVCMFVPDAGTHQLKPSRGSKGSATILPAMAAARCELVSEVHHGSAGKARIVCAVQRKEREEAPV